MLACLATHFQFPDCFGNNWDAAYDLLLDKVDALAVDTSWRFSSGSAVHTDPEAITSFLQLMQDLVDYASDRGIRLQVELFLDSGEVD
ncbi:Barstar (barnase inhibitor) [Alkalimonas amylolytica]|uniref:Barstar (Barnase inhibitor) n=2 Tax=Alkalimonas amylolytica TaxID=152573 RepID=A0A1H4E5X0_ALKAM|nr:Barstar (barnase inhibitor) [Alkalimonas amylolytica]